MYSKTSLADELQLGVRAYKAKRKAVFDDIHILQEHDFWTDEKIIEYLSKEFGEAEALLWLRRFKEQKMLDSEKDYLKEQAQLSGEIDKINKTLKRMENRIEEQE